MSEHTPTTDDVLIQYAGSQFSNGYGETNRRNREAAFDRWLNSVKAEAWAEGYEARTEDQYTGVEEYGVMFYDVTENPYV